MRASSSIRSECSARDAQIFCPRTTYPAAIFSAAVWIDGVSDPAPGSVTPNACRRSSPLAILGRRRSFCSALPCRRIVPIVYICAWHAAELQPEALTSSRMTFAAARPSPAPPCSSGISAASQPSSVSA